MKSISSVIKMSSVDDALRSQLRSGKKNWETILDLIRQGANPDIQNPIGLSALHMAVISDSAPVVESLLELGANPDIQDRMGNRPLHLVKSPEVAELLISRTLPDPVNRLGNTPLHTITNPEIIRLLILRGADPGITNEKGLTAGEVHPEFQELIRDSIRERNREIPQRRSILEGSPGSPIPGYPGIRNSLNMELQEELDRSPNSLIKYRIQELLSLFDFISTKDMDKWNIVMEQALKAIKDSRQIPKLYRMSNELLGIDLEHPCENWDLDYISQEPFSGIPIERYFVLVFPNGKRYCVSLDTLEYAVNNYREFQRTPRGPFQKYYRIPLDFNFWLDQRQWNRLRRAIRDNQPLPRVWLNPGKTIIIPGEPITSLLYEVEYAEPGYQ